MSSNSQFRRAALIASFTLLTGSAHAVDPGAQATSAASAGFPPVVADDQSAAAATDFPPVVDDAPPAEPAGAAPPVVEDKAATAATPDIPPVARSKGSSGTHKKSDATDDAVESRSSEKHQHHASEYHDGTHWHGDHPLQEKVRRAARHFGGSLLRSFADH